MEIDIEWDIGNVLYVMLPNCIISYKQRDSLYLVFCIFVYCLQYSSNMLEFAYTSDQTSCAVHNVQQFGDIRLRKERFNLQ